MVNRNNAKTGKGKKLEKEGGGELKKKIWKNIHPWNSLSNEVTNANSVNNFKKLLDEQLHYCISAGVNKILYIRQNGQEEIRNLL